MNPTSTSLAQLDLETRAHHESADEVWLALQRSGTTKLDYVHQLVRAYGFEAPLEAAFAYTPQLRVVIDLRERSRAGLLAQDLLALGLSPNEVAKLPQCSSIASFHHPYEALGWLYVNERATLHFDAVRRHLEDHVLGVIDGLSYLSAYGANVNKRWTELGQSIDGIATTTHLLGRVITGAHAAFDRLNKWFGTESLHRQAHG